MQNISLPEPLYLEAARAAKASGVSLERFIRDAVQLHLNDGFDQSRELKLTPEQVAIIRRSQAEAKAGNVFTSEQVRAELAADREAWLRENRP